MFLERQSFNKLKHDIISLQTFCRIVIAKKTLLNLRKLRSSIIIQKTTRRYICKKNYKQNLKRIKSIQLFYRNYKNRIINEASIKIQSKYRSVYYKTRYQKILSKIRLLQNKFRLYLKNQSKVKSQNKKLKSKLEKQEQKLEEFKVLANQAKEKETKTKRDLKTLEDGMRRSITEKMILSRKLEELMIENDRIRKMKTNSIAECILM